VAINDSATNFPIEHSEFDAAALEREPSAAVRPPRVAAAPIAFECRASGEHVVGNCTMVFGEVVHLAADRAVLADDGLPDAQAVDPLSRLGRAEWSTLGEVISLPRIRYGDWRDGRRSSGLRAADDRRGDRPT
jgi:flavin reductase (DIM6/NTAB) family NADH-FMN oxidoreductase RutF